MSPERNFLFGEKRNEREKKKKEEKKTGFPFPKRHLHTGGETQANQPGQKSAKSFYCRGEDKIKSVCSEIGSLR